jgi:hypothetical protein
MDEKMLYNEYKFLRDEIHYYINLNTTLTTFSITVVAGIIALGVNNKNAFIFLLSFIIIIPLFYRIQYNKDAISRLSAYLIVFIEPKIHEINWETINAESVETINKGNKGVYNISRIIRYNEFTLLAFASSSLFIFTCLHDKNCYSLVEIIASIISMLTTLGIAYSTYKGNQTAKNKERHIDDWKIIKLNLENKMQ